jgi:hypothetical protein
MLKAAFMNKRANGSNRMEELSEGEFPTQI